MCVRLYDVVGNCVLTCTGFVGKNFVCVCSYVFLPMYDLHVNVCECVDVRTAQ